MPAPSRCQPLPQEISRLPVRLQEGLSQRSVPSRLNLAQLSSWHLLASSTCASSTSMAPAANADDIPSAPYKAMALMISFFFICPTFYKPGTSEMVEDVPGVMLAPGICYRQLETVHIREKVSHR